MLLLRGIPEDEDLKVTGGGVTPTTVPAVSHRDTDVEPELRLVQPQNSTAEARIVNWHQPKRDV